VAVFFRSSFLYPTPAGVTLPEFPSYAPRPSPLPLPIRVPDSVPFFASHQGGSGDYTLFRRLPPSAPPPLAPLSFFLLSPLVGRLLQGFFPPTQDVNTWCCSSLAFGSLLSCCSALGHVFALNQESLFSPVIASRILVIRTWPIPPVKNSSVSFLRHGPLFTALYHLARLYSCTFLVLTFKDPDSLNSLQKEDVFACFSFIALRAVQLDTLQRPFPPSKRRVNNYASSNATSSPPSAIPDSRFLDCGFPPFPVGHVSGPFPTIRWPRTFFSVCSFPPL